MASFTVSLDDELSRIMDKSPVRIEEPVRAETSCMSDRYSLSAVRMQEQFQLSYWDGMILAAAERTGAGILYSEDFSHNRTYGSIRCINPYL